MNLEGRLGEDNVDRVTNIVCLPAYVTSRCDID